MGPTAQLWRRLVEDAQHALPDCREVRGYPVHRAADGKKFLEDVPELRLPACLIVCGLNRREVLGQQLKRTIRWSGIIIVQDETGRGAEQATDLADLFEAEVLDRDIVLQDGR